MPKYKVAVERTWREQGRLLVPADDADEARDIAMGALLDDEGGIIWDAHTMAVDSNTVIAVEEARDEAARHRND